LVAGLSLEKRNLQELMQERLVTPAQRQLKELAAIRVP
jgi:hypothetical protein